MRVLLFLILVSSTSAYEFNVVLGMKARRKMKYYNGKKFQIKDNYFNTLYKISRKVKVVDKIYKKNVPLIIKNIDYTLCNTTEVLKKSMIIPQYHWKTTHNGVCIPSVGVVNSLANNDKSVGHWKSIEYNKITPMHFDTSNNYLWCLHGQKYILLFSPNDHKNLYLKLDVGGEGVTSTPDYILEGKIDYNKYPLLKNIKPYFAVVRKNELLYIPDRWVHHVYTFNNTYCKNFWVQQYQKIKKIP